MAQIKFSLSKKVDDSAKQEIMIRFYNGNAFNLRAKSEVYVSPKFFEYNINNNEHASERKTSKTTATVEEAIKKGYDINMDDGNIVIRQRVETDEVKYHQEAQNKLASIKQAIIDAYRKADKTTVKGNWLKKVVLYAVHPEHKDLDETYKTFDKWAEEYIVARQISASNQHTVRCDVRHVLRYEGFRRAIDDKDFRFDVNTVTRDDIDMFVDYLRNEHKLQYEYPTIFKKLFKEIPNRKKKANAVPCKSMKKEPEQQIEERGENTITKIGQQIKSIFGWIYDEGKTTNRPWEGVKLNTPKYGVPWYITKEERDIIYTSNIEDERLKVQRDIFIFHSYVGPRVGDLIKLTEGHITNGVLCYTPSKTSKNDKPVQARVPLHPVALELIEKYRGVDKKGRLFPFISPQKYNDALKEIFTLVGITRQVEIRNPKTGEIEMKPLNKIVSSHMGRRTFIGNLYFMTPDPNLIGKMSGHKEGSRAFTRYRNIEDEQLAKLIHTL